MFFPKLTYITYIVQICIFFLSIAFCKFGNPDAKMKISYLDSASATKIDSRVLEVMLPYFDQIYANPSSTHSFGKQAKKGVEDARKQVADLINADPSEIIFTSGATESINLALKGFVEANEHKGNHIITVKTEHKAVLATTAYLETRGIDVTYLDVDKNGLISFAELENAIRKDTLLICIMYVNNETGVIQPTHEIGLIAQTYGIPFFCDATQAVGKMEVNVKKSNIDLLCLSGHKFNGPKGVGALYKRSSLLISPILHGGSQENGLRAGTYNTPLIVGLGEACEIAQQNLTIYQNHYHKLHEYLFQKLKSLASVQAIAPQAPRILNIISLRLTNTDANMFVQTSNDVILGNGSACNSGIIEGSHVLTAMGYSEKESKECIRISFDKNSTSEDVDQLINQLERQC